MPMGKLKEIIVPVIVFGTENIKIYENKYISYLEFVLPVEKLLYIE